MPLIPSYPTLANDRLDSLLLQEFDDTISAFAKAETISFSFSDRVFLTYQAAQLGVSGVRLFLKSRIAEDWGEQEFAVLTNVLALGCRHQHHLLVETLNELNEQQKVICLAVLAQNTDSSTFEKVFLAFLPQMVSLKKYDEISLLNLVRLISKQQPLSPHLLKEFLASIVLILAPHPLPPNLIWPVRNLLKVANQQKVKIVEGSLTNIAATVEKNLPTWSEVIENDFLTKNKTADQYLSQIGDVPLSNLFEVYPESWDGVQETLLAELAREPLRLQKIIQQLLQRAMNNGGNIILHRNYFALLDKLSPVTALKTLDIIDTKRNNYSTPVLCLIDFWKANLYEKMGQSEKALRLFAQTYNTIKSLNPIIEKTILLNAHLPLSMRREFAARANPLEGRVLAAGFDLANQTDDWELMSRFLPTLLERFEEKKSVDISFFPTQNRTTQIFLARLKDKAAQANNSSQKQRAWKNIGERLLRKMSVENGETNYFKRQRVQAFIKQDPVFLGQLLRDSFQKNVEQEDTAATPFNDTFWEGVDYRLIASISTPAFLKEIKNKVPTHLLPFYACLFAQHYYQKKSELKTF